MRGSSAQRVLDFLSKSGPGWDDDELARQLDVSPQQSINQVCRKLADEGRLHRYHAGVRYMRNVFPLLDIGWTRRDCRAYLTAHGWGGTPRSACIGCPYRSSSSWAEMKATAPEEFEDAVAFDAAIRHGHPAATRSGMPLRGTYYLHHSRRPLDEADLGADDTPEQEGCSPWACRGNTEDEPAPGGEDQ